MSAHIVEPKPGVNMGRVLVPIRIENVTDRDLLSQGQITADQMRAVEVEALVDTGATFLCLPTSLVNQLGLPFDRQKEARTVAGPMMLDIHRGARLEVQGRSCTVEVMAIPDGRQVLLGQLPLETLDYWVDVTHHRLVGNPEHGGQWMAEIYAAD